MVNVFNPHLSDIMTRQQVTWSPVLLLHAFKLINQSLGFAFVGPPVWDVRPQLSVPALRAVLVGRDHLVARSPELTKSDLSLKATHQSRERLNNPGNAITTAPIILPKSLNKPHQAL